jgi:TM2 domain-containing membrane protein YozV
MENTFVYDFLDRNREVLFPNSKYTEEEVAQALLMAPDMVMPIIEGFDFHDPSMALVISVIVGSIGFDRFYFKQFFLGLLKWVTMGGLGIWWIIDIINAKKNARTYNCKIVMDALCDPETIVNKNERKAKVVSTAKKWAPVAKQVYKGAKEISNAAKGFQDTMYL